MPRPAEVDWIAIGFALLIAEGYGALTLERLCQAAGRTRGSLYHQHGSLPGYKAALLAHWRQDHTERLIAEAEQVAEATSKLARLDRLASALDFRLERAVRAWARLEGSAEAVVRDADRARVAYLARLVAAAQGVPAEEAERTALLDYALFLGTIDMVDPGHRERLAALSGRVRFLVEEPQPSKRRK